MIHKDSRTPSSEGSADSHVIYVAVLFSRSLDCRKSYRTGLSRHAMAHSAKRAKWATADQLFAQRQAQPTNEEIEAAAELRKAMLLLYLKKGISAKDFCVIAHWMQLSHGKGVEDFAKKPSSEEKHYNDHLQLVIARQYRNPALEYYPIPMMSKKSTARDIVQIPFNLPTEQLARKYFVGNTSPSEHDLQQALPPLPCFDPIGDLDIFRSHPVVKKCERAGIHRSRIRAGGIYMDAAKYSNNDSFEGIFYNDIESGYRCLVVVVRKSELCNCGCRGWCTLFAMQQVIAADLNNGARGRWSDVDSFGRPHQGPGMEHRQSRPKQMVFFGDNGDSRRLASGSGSVLLARLLLFYKILNKKCYSMYELRFNLS